MKEYDEATLKKVQQMELAILKDFIQICTENNLSYFGLAGTGIGAVSYTHLKKLYSGTGDVAAYNGNVSSDESHGIIERQADTLASALLMPLPQIKKCFYRLRMGRTDEQLIAEMANIFEVSKQAMQIRLESRNLI